MTNGIDESAVRALASSIPGNPERGRVQFSARTEWRDGAHTTTVVRHFTVPSDEPARLGWTDLAPNAVELLLSALGACLSVGFVYTAALQGVAIRMLAIEVVGRIDLASFLGLPVATPAGYSEIRVDCRARSPRHRDFSRHRHAPATGSGRTDRERDPRGRPVPWGCHSSAAESASFARSCGVEPPMTSPKSPRRALSATFSRSISRRVRTPKRRMISIGGHHPWRAC
jgi:hypothetical protein